MLTTFQIEKINEYLDANASMAHPVSSSMLVFEVLKKLGASVRPTSLKQYIHQASRAGSFPRHIAVKNRGFVRKDEYESYKKCEAGSSNTPKIPPPVIPSPTDDMLISVVGPSRKAKNKSTTATAMVPVNSGTSLVSTNPSIDLCQFQSFIAQSVSSFIERADDAEMKIDLCKFQAHALQCISAFIDRAGA